MKTNTHFTLAAAMMGLLAFSPTANAADLGGDCCADLEERVATLEATTARKGNRKVSLTISGSVSQALMIWDDGIDSDAYVVSNENLSNRISFKGSAKINNEWSAGYQIELQFLSASSGLVDQNDDDAGYMNVRKSFMYVKSKSLGKVSWGLVSHATDDMVFWGDLAGLWNISEGDSFIGTALQVNRTTGLTIGNVTSSASTGNFGAYDGEGRKNAIRYDSPTISGFTLSAAWGEDEYWDVALTTSQTFGDVKFGAAVGYAEFDGRDGGNLNAARGIQGQQSLQFTAGLMHKPTGLFLQGAYYTYQYDTSAGFSQADFDTWFVQTGIKTTLNSLGKTTFFGQYTEWENGHAGATLAQVATGASTEADSVRVGIIQYVDAASLELYASYEHIESELNGLGQNDIDIVAVGGVIFF